MQSFKELIEQNEGWLTDHVVHLAQESGHTQYSSTLREAWRISVCGVSKPLIEFIEQAQSASSPREATVKHLTEFGIAQGHRHRAMGISLSSFVGLLKLYRSAYLDLVAEKETDPEQRLQFHDLIFEVFDAMEIGILKAWENLTETERLAELQARNRELSNEKNKYLTVFESIAEPAILLNPEDQPTHVNAAANRLLLGETKPGAGYYGDLSSPVLKDIVTRILTARGKDADTAQPLKLETTGGTLVFHVAIQQMLDISKKFAGTVIILQDVTEYLQAIDAARAAERAKSVFLTTLSHEIRTPINNILGLTGLLDDGSASPDKARHLQSMRASGEMLSTLIENSLGLSKAESNALQLIEQDFNLAELCEALFRVLDLKEFRQQLRLERFIAPDVPIHLNGDSHKLRHILMNLLSNALKFTEAGTVTLSISASGNTAGGRHELRFDVIDTGKGLDEDEIDQLFEPYYQSHKSREHSQTHGSGLGLAISKRLVEFLGGKIEYRPNPLGGSVFRFCLAFEDSHHPQTSDLNAAGHRVLVVEDDPVNAIVFESYLQDLGHNVRVAETYQDAIDALDQQEFEIVVTDYKLDGKTGLDVARAVEQLEARKGLSIPVIVVTAAIPEDALETMGHSNVRLFLEKPFSRYELANALASVTHRPAPATGESAPASDNDVDRHVKTSDLNRLLTDLGFERCEAVVQSYQASASDLIAGMQRMFGAANLSGLSEQAHQLVSASGFVGAWKIVEMSKDLTRLSKTGNMQAVGEKLAALETESDLTKQALEDYWHQIASAYDSD
ncbi:ATP-binding protein [Roseovarius sp. 2305UL8-3]|uniref:ATP-binding protein n=1 Tax=Roseovarius conchicola TaxID=3121636 RepID=UPI003527E074